MQEYSKRNIVAEVKNKCVISTVIGKYIKLQRRGNVFIGLCPFHNEKTPSFHVNDVQGNYHCFGCGEHGDVLEYLVKTQKLPFVEALQQLAQMVGVDYQVYSPKPKRSNKIVTDDNKSHDGDDYYETVTEEPDYYEIMEQVCDYYHKQLFAHGGNSALQYLANRGIDSETIKKFRIGWASPRKQQQEFLGQFNKDALEELGVYKNGQAKFHNRIMFPILDRRQRVIAFGGRIIEHSDFAPKYLNSPDTPIFHKGANLYGQHLYDYKATSPIIVCEGYADAIALYNAGFHCALAPLGTSITDEQIQLLLRFANQGKKIICCFDGDTAGLRAAIKLGHKIIEHIQPQHEVKIMLLGAGQDPDSFIRQNGVKAFNQMLEYCINVFDLLWQTMIASKDITSVNGKAQVRAGITTNADTIKDYSVRSSAKEYWRNKLYKLTWRGRKQQPEQSVQEISTSYDANNIQELLFVAIMIEWPDLVYKHLNKLYRVELHNNDAKALLDLIMDWIHDASDVPASQSTNNELLRDYIIKTNGQKHMAMIQQVSATHLYRGTDEEKIDEYWQGLYNHIHELRNMYQELKVLQQIDHKDDKVGERDNWLRIQELNRLITQMEQTS